PAGTPIQNGTSRPSRAQLARIGIHLNRRQPLKQDLSNFALSQASQKIYEATFLKDFLAHALHPNQLVECFDDARDKEDLCARLEGYLRSVSNNTTKIANKMVRGTHLRTVNLLAKDGKDSLPFLNYDRTEKRLFDDFGPGHMIEVAHRLNESWHRAFKSPPMVQYSTKHYPLGTQCSPLEEIDEVADTLFRNANKSLCTGRVLRPLTKRKNSERALPGAVLRDDELPSRGNWLPARSPPQYPASRNSTPAQASSSLFVEEGPPSKTEKSTFAPPSSTSSDLGFPPLGMSSPTHDRACTNFLASDAEMVGAARGPPVSATCAEDTVVPSNAANVAESQLEILFQRYGLSALMPDADALLKPDEAVAEVPKNVNWRSKLLDDHKRRLASKIPQAQAQAQPPHIQPPYDIKSIVAQAVAGGILKPPTSAVQKQINKRAAQEKKKLPSQNPKLLPLHASGSKTLEPHQTLPPSAYFEPTSEEELPAWRCGIRHPMGYYYSAGDRKSCIGCNTNVSKNPQLHIMDFYLPSKTYYFQPAPGVVWKPSKIYKAERKCRKTSHNAVAKHAYWTAIHNGSAEDAAMHKAIEAVEEHIRPKPKLEPPRTLTPEPEPVPVDLGPHPSGSKTMEHGQEIPECHYFPKNDDQEEFAWRCDVNHALGRYYLAWNKKTCPGCGSRKLGGGKQAEMDFYMPSGAVVRQEAPGLSKWQPRRPYNLKKASKVTPMLSHNQMCAKKYWVAVDGGQDHEQALRFAIKETDTDLDAKEEEKMKRWVKSESKEPS
ncbi:hypothetical protein BDV95DRAFT_467814, partial [Massariosphaeria phaeospora]